MSRAGGIEKGATGLRLGELLLLAALWMLFGFTLWYYLAAFHVAPVRIASEALLAGVLGDTFHGIVPHPERHFLLQVQTRIPFVFPDGERAALGFIVNPLIYGYGLPLMFGLVMASNATWLRKLTVLAAGLVAMLAVETWGVFWESLTKLRFEFGDEAAAAVAEAGLPDTLIALCYQLGVLILPALVPVMIWVYGNWQLVEQFTGWRAAGERGAGRR